MTNPSSSSPPSSSSRQRRHSQETNDDDEVNHGIPFPARPEEDDELSPPRLEWEFRLAATLPSPALAGSSDYNPAGGIARRVRIYSVDDFLHLSSSSSCSHAACICVPAKLSSVRWRPQGNSVGCGDYDGVVTKYDARSATSTQGAGCGHSTTAPRRVHDRVRLRRPDDAHLGPARPLRVVVATARQAVLCVEFDPSGGRQLAVGSVDRRAAVYDMRALGRVLVAYMDGHARAVTYVRM